MDSRLDHLSTFHGMGLMYRCFEMPPFPRFHRGEHSYRDDPVCFDDYRAAEVLFGNGGYLFYYPGMYVVTECLLVGTLQRYYALQPIREVYYWKDGGWQTLPQLVAAGIDPLPVPWAPQPDCLKRIQIHYANGLRVVVNRLAEEFSVRVEGQVIVLPRSGWVAWMPEGQLLAYSAYAPGTRKRVDFLHDRTADLRYLARAADSGWARLNPHSGRVAKSSCKSTPVPVTPGLPGSSASTSRRKLLRFPGSISISTGTRSVGPDCGTSGPCGSKTVPSRPKSWAMTRLWPPRRSICRRTA